MSCHTEWVTEQTTQYEQVPEPQYAPVAPLEQAAPVEQTTAVFDSVDKADRISSTRTLYDASAGEIFWRNFLSGFARGFGMILVYVIFIVVVSLLVARFILPTVQPFINQYSDLMKSVSAMQQSTGAINEQLNSIKLPGTIQPAQSQPTQGQSTQSPVDQQNQVNQLYRLQNELLNGQSAK